jgi:hypothetical protein
MNVDENIIRERAYQIWEAEGRPEGRADDNWRQAAEERQSTDAGPASVAPGPDGPDPVPQVDGASPPREGAGFSRMGAGG